VPDQAPENNVVLNIRRSCLGQAWHFRVDGETCVETLMQKSGLEVLQARLLAGRRIKPQHVDDFLNPTLRRLLPDPSNLADMDRAAGLILDALESGRSVFVFADYDVDGATSAAQIIRWARHYGYDIGLYIPDRIKEGYGPSEAAFKALKANSAELVITVDCGATAYDALDAAAKMKLDTIVIDHHMMMDTGPKCAALVNPNRPDDESGLGYLAAAGVSFMLLVALTREAGRRDWDDPPDLLNFLGLAALGTICDVMPLQGLNRAIVRQGLKKLSQPGPPGQGGIAGLAALAEVAGAEPPFTTYHAGFIFGPRLNAGGRIGNPLMGAELLITDNTQTAFSHAAELDHVNAERKTIQEDVLRESIEQLSPFDENCAVIVVAMEGWHPGVIGIVAGRLKDRFRRPSVVIGIDGNRLGRGSGRSIRGVDLGQAIHKAAAQGYILSGGGHTMAAGMSIRAEDIDKFREFMNRELSGTVRKSLEHRALDVDALLAPSAVSFETLDQIDAFAPYGVGNPRPVFAISNMVCTYAKRLRGGHLRCGFRHAGSGHTLGTVCFGAEESGLDAVLTDINTPPLHLAVHLSRKKWQGRDQLDVQLLDAAFA